MAIVYCDWTSGNDTTGTGTAALPYKTINKASTGLGGGDEVRVAKAGAHSQLAVNLIWTDGSVAVATVSTLVGTVAVRDFIGKNVEGDRGWYEVTAITTTQITLRSQYSGTSENCVGFKMAFHNLGSAAAAGTILDSIVGVGAAGNPLLVSGGWNLASEAQDVPETVFCQTHTSARNGVGLNGATNRNYVTFSKLTFCRCATNWNFSASIGQILEDCAGYSAGTSNYVSASITSRADRFTAGGSGGVNFSHTGRDGFFTDLYTHGALGTTSNPGVSITGANCVVKKVSSRCNTATYAIVPLWNTIFGEVVVENNAQSGFRPANTAQVPIMRIGKLVATNNLYAIYLAQPGQIIIGTYIGTDNVTSDFGSVTNIEQSNFPYVTVQRWDDVEGDCRAFWGAGITQRDTDESVTGACIKASPTHATAPLYVKTGQYKVLSTDANLRLGLTVKKTADFDGTISFFGRMNGMVVTEEVATTPTTAYDTFYVTVLAADLILNEWLEMVVNVVGTVGSIYMDNFVVI